jgi:hypothetical protein
LTGSIPREQQFSGSLIGQCLGDALGFVVEGHPPEACQRYVEEVLKKTGHAGGYPPNDRVQYGGRPPYRTRSEADIESSSLDTSPDKA